MLPVSEMDITSSGQLALLKSGMYVREWAFVCGSAAPY